MQYPKVSVIVLNYNGKRHLKECFESLRRIDYPDYEVIMVDNASQDGSIDYVRQDFPEVKVLALDKNYGFAEGNNRGANIAQEEFIAFLNNDTKVDANWLRELATPALCDKDIAICASKILFYDMPDTLNHAGGLITPIGGGIDIGLGRKDDCVYDSPRYVGMGCGAAILVRKSAFDELGGFDGDYFGYQEDVDLSWRCWLYGYKVFYVPTAVIYHKSRGTWASEYSAQAAYHTQINRLYNLLKNAGAGNVIKGLILTVGFDVYRIIRHLRARRFQGIKAILAANIDFLSHLRKTISKRRYIQSRRRINDKAMLKMGLVASLMESVKELCYYSAWYKQW